MSFKPPFIRIIAPVVAIAVLPSCDRTDPGMAEKVAMLEAELRERDRRLAAAEEETEEAKSNATHESSSSNGVPNLVAARTSYLGFVDALRGKLSGEMANVSFERTSVFPVEGPDPSKPIFSRVAFRIQSKDGRDGEVVLPVYADASGNWLEPDIAEVVDRLKKQLATPAKPQAVSVTEAATESATNPPSSPARQPERSQPVDAIGAQRTVQVEWGDTPRTAAPPPQNQAGVPTTQPQAPTSAGQQPSTPTPAMPKKVMPTSRDVIIDFE